MNTQIRRLFVIVLVMFAALGVALTNNQFLRAQQLTADSRNTRSIYQAAEIERGPIIVGGEAVATSTLIEGSKRYQRSYPQGPLYAPVTGWFSASFSSATGLEAAADTTLDGQTDALFLQRMRNLVTGQSRQGGGVVLTIDPAMQKVAAEQLGDRRGAVVALDVRTGAVLALYSSPSFDPNQLAQAEGSAAAAAHQTLSEAPGRPLMNRAIAGDLYAPGSTFKVLTTVALLEKGEVTADTPMPSPVEATLPGSSTTVPNIESAECGNGKPTLTEAFARSCNTTFVLASASLTHDELAHVATRFGFGTEEDIPVPVTPSVFPDSTDQAQLALASIGQYSVRATPLLMAQVAQAIGNGGEMMQPYLVAEVVDHDLQVRSTTAPSSRGRATDRTTAATVTSMMRAVVEQPYGTGGELAIDGIPVAAKTGTAEVGGDSGRANAWAIGFAPADDPKIAFAVLVEGDDTEPVPHGGTTAAPIARALLEAGLQ
ncbi:penicillin-binding protein 2 [Schaalia sp. 19OD2882]|uniref:peptidoglycan D,D-transpeptidase FtsI family protein n=1 Tax=Schaalia sp. 19OD2882 TaxID=2794089 RepID=UPI001C1EEA0B|nr:penicillin-binding transpeptidase domain-containing protein [Schaalia sp. 19OD2882]QWW19615.1 penicillin-binding protein 2 [Schaalia sp. 19OD2882]